jgi:predicted DCC family thiol-disulfide oxidoreductase YuxK
VANSPETLEPLTAEQLLELEEAWAELAKAAEASELENFHACTRNGRSWTENAAAVRAVAATLREFPALDAQPPG